MRILFFSDHFKPEPTAAASNVFERARLWVAEGHDVTVLCAAPNFPEGRLFPGYRNSWRHVELMDGIRVVRVKTFIRPNEGFFLRILDYLSYTVSSMIVSLFEPKPDVVFSTSPHLFVPIAGVFCARLKRRPHVMEIRDLWPASILATGSMKRGVVYTALEKLELWLYARSKHLITLTEAFRKDIASRGVRLDRITTVINGANLQLFTPREKDADQRRGRGLDGKYVIGYVGTMGLAHGLENAIHAAALLRDTSIVFLFVGPGPKRKELEQLAAELNLNNVVFAPAQPKELVPDMWALCDASLIHLRPDPIFATVIPSKIFESMAMGLPIIFCGPEGEGSRIVVNEGAGLTVESNDPALLALAAKRFLEAPAETRKMAGRSRSAAPKFSRERQASDCLRVLMGAADMESHAGKASVEQS